MRLCDRRDVVVQSAIAVQGTGMGSGIQKANGLMLAVHLSQSLGQRPQRIHPDGLIIDEGAAAAIRSQDPTQDQLLPRLHLQPLVTGLGQPVGIRRRVEGGSGHGLRGAGPHQPGVGAGTQCQTQGIQNDRLARAGLAGQHGQAGADLKVQPVHQHNVANRQGGQHGRRPVSRSE